eukprot:TRINITY_DN10994_c0_g1_i1.p1 TRINITY_DN10994_c0_g1~~TRINITY_DN10994_c0_g1_i1.p1  ORF type:complete len:312 (+),score=81.79 TRINITY_DN10994_c0_g1_i1:13-948(+)
MVVTAQTSLEQYRACTPKGNLVIHTVQKNQPFLVTLAINTPFINTNSNVITTHPDFSNLISLDSSLVFDDDLLNPVPNLSQTDSKLVTFEGQLSKSSNGSLLMNCNVKIHTLTSKFEKSCFRVKFTSRHQTPNSTTDSPLSLSCFTDPIQVYAKAKRHLKRKRSESDQQQLPPEKKNNTPAIDVDQIMAVLERMEEKQNAIYNKMERKENNNNKGGVQREFERVFKKMMRLYSDLSDGVGQGSKAAAVRSILSNSGSDGEVVCWLQSFESQVKQSENGEGNEEGMGIGNGSGNGSERIDVGEFDLNCTTEQ